MRDKMNGKKVTLVFLVLTILTGMMLAVWMKQGYESRPKETAPAEAAPAVEEKK